MIRSLITLALHEKFHTTEQWLFLCLFQRNLGQHPVLWCIRMKSKTGQMKPIKISRRNYDEMGRKEIPRHMRQSSDHCKVLWILYFDSRQWSRWRKLRPKVNSVRIILQFAKKTDLMEAAPATRSSDKTTQTRSRPHESSLTPRSYNSRLPVLSNYVTSNSLVAKFSATIWITSLRGSSC